MYVVCALGLNLNILTEPFDTFSVSLAHDDGAHEDLKRSDLLLKSNLTLTGGLVKAKALSQLVLGNGASLINLVTENEERNISQLLNTKEGIEFSLTFGKSAGISSIDKEDNAANLREVVSPQTTGLKMSTEIESSEFNVANGKLLRGCELRQLVFKRVFERKSVTWMNTY